MFKSLFAGIVAVLFANGAHAQCSGFQSNVELAFTNYQYYSAQHPIVATAYDDVFEETVRLIARSPHLWHKPEGITFEDVAPALGSLIGFAIICEINQPHCDRFLEKVEPQITTLILNLSMGYANRCWS